MKLLTIIAAGATASLFTFAAYAAPSCTSGFCNGGSGGAQCQLNGQTHTCGTCMGGGTSVLYVGSLSASAANDACACQHEPTAACSSQGQAVLDGQPKPTLGTKEEAAAAKIRETSPAAPGGDAPAPAPAPRRAPTRR